jgi:hypothetical protein
MRRRARAWITTLALGLGVGGCLPCVPGVRVDAPRTATCLAAASGGCAESQAAHQVAARANRGDSTLER